MRILVICGAGASSTFVAQRLRHAAQDAGLEVKAVAGTPQSLLVELVEADLVLVGPHLAGSLDAIERDASARGAAAALLPDDIFGDLDGSRTLALVQAVLARTEPTGEASRHADTTRRMT